MSFPIIPGGESIPDFSQNIPSSEGAVKVPKSILKTTTKSNKVTRSIIKKSGESSGKSSKGVHFSSFAEVKDVEKYLDPYVDDAEDDDAEDDEEDLDPETQRNTEINEREGSQVQSHRDFFIQQDSGERRTFEDAEDVYKKLTSSGEGKSVGFAASQTSNKKSYLQETQQMQRAMFSRRSASRSRTQSSGLLGRITTNLNSLGNSIGALCNRISSAISRCISWIRSNVVRQNADESQPILISVVYDPKVYSQLDRTSDLE